jgi:lantibiotic modifying enzyme
LEGDCHLQARDALDALSERYLRLDLARWSDISLWSGIAGVALVQSALDRFAPERGHRALAERALDRTLRRVGRAPLREGFSGLVGIGWVLARLVATGDEGEDDDPCATFDDVIGRALARPRWTRSFDLIGGLVGYGVYALERLPRPSGRSMCARVVNHLHASARRRRPGVAWWSDPRWLPRAERTEPNLDWNLGVAHGVPGVVALLSRAVVADLDATTHALARELLERSVTWILAQELPASAEGAFPYAVGRNLARAPARLAWCYGDVGVAATLLLAARAAGDADWERAAMRIALRAVARSERSAGVEDAGLCHGAAGVAHIFHRLYRATGEERLADAARGWFARALAMRTPGRGVAGFRSHRADAAAGSRFRSDATFLTGAGGIALALLAAIGAAEPTETGWDRVLLLP